MSGFAPEVREPSSPASVGRGTLKLLVASLLALGAYYGAVYLTADFEKALGTGSVGTKAHQIPGSVENFEKAVQGMKETSDLLVNWAIVLFGGTIGIAILAKGARIRDRNWGLIFVAPTWVLLYASLLHGSRFRGSLTFQLATGQYVFRDLNLELFLQRRFFELSLVALIVLAVWYLFFRFSLLEERSAKGD